MTKVPNCSTWLTVTAFLSILCNDTDVGISQCDAHCRCSHKASWGTCIPWPKDDPTRPNPALLDPTKYASNITNLMCTCNYKDPVPQEVKAVRVSFPQDVGEPLYNHNILPSKLKSTHCQ
jgi:hypothetical protein